MMDDEAERSGEWSGKSLMVLLVAGEEGLDYPVVAAGSSIAGPWTAALRPGVQMACFLVSRLRQHRALLMLSPLDVCRLRVVCRVLNSSEGSACAV